MYREEENVLVSDYMLFMYSITIGSIIDLYVSNHALFVFSVRSLTPFLTFFIPATLGIFLFMKFCKLTIRNWDSISEFIENTRYKLIRLFGLFYITLFLDNKLKKGFKPSNRASIFFWKDEERALVVESKTFEDREKMLISVSEGQIYYPKNSLSPIFVLSTNPAEWVPSSWMRNIELKGKPFWGVYLSTYFDEFGHKHRHTTIEMVIKPRELEEVLTKFILDGFKIQISPTSKRDGVLFDFILSEIDRVKEIIGEEYPEKVLW